MSPRSADLGAAARWRSRSSVGLWRHLLRALILLVGGLALMVIGSSTAGAEEPARPEGIRPEVVRTVDVAAGAPGRSTVLEKELEREEALDRPMPLVERQDSHGTRPGSAPSRTIPVTPAAQAPAEAVRPAPEAVVEPVVREVAAPVAPVSREVGEQAPSTAGALAAPVVGDVYEQLAPVARDVPEQLSPVVRDVSEQLAPVVRDVSEQLAPVVRDVSEQLAPVAPDAAAPLLGVVTEQVDFATASTRDEVSGALSPAPEPAAPVVQAAGVSSSDVREELEDQAQLLGVGDEPLPLVAITFRDAAGRVPIWSLIADASERWVGRSSGGGLSGDVVRTSTPLLGAALPLPCDRALSSSSPAPEQGSAAGGPAQTERDVRVTAAGSQAQRPVDLWRVRETPAPALTAGVGDVPISPA